MPRWLPLVVCILFLPVPKPAWAFAIAPSVAFTARRFLDGTLLHLSSGNVIANHSAVVVGDGCCLFVQSFETFTDVVILQFPLVGAVSNPGPVYLNFYAINEDRTNDFLGPGQHFGTVSVFAFSGDGTVNANDFWKLPDAYPGAALTTPRSGRSPTRACRWDI